MSTIEALVSAAIFASVTAGTYLLYTTMQDTLSKGELLSELQQNARVGLDQMNREVPLTGYDPTGVIALVATPPKASIRAASSGCFSFVADISASGTGPASQISYYLNGTTLYRRFDDWNGKENFKDNSAQPLAGSLASLDFTYYDANNQVLDPAKVPPSTRRCPPSSKTGVSVQQLTFDQMRRIRRLTITITAQGSRPRVVSQAYTLTSDVYLRNQ